MLKRLSVLSVTALMLLVYGCSTPGPRRASIGGLEMGVRPEAIRAEAIVTLSKMETIRGRAIIVAKRPGFFRIDVFGPFGRDLAIFASDGKTLAFFLKGSLRVFEHGRPGIPGNLSPRRFVSILLGDKRRKSIEGDKLKEEREGAPETSTADKNTAPEPEINLSDFREVDGAVIPHNISITYDGRRLEIRYRKIEIDPKIEKKVFNITGLH